MLSEFDLIQRYFADHSRADQHLLLGPGDDCALIQPTAGMTLAVSTDMLVSGRHFFADEDPRRLGHKCLAVNLSDLAAMGARPLGFTLALALPEARPEWLQPFAEGLLALADLHQCRLIGGDTTKGPLNICITIYGELPAQQALRRDAARPGDDIWISGTLGDARLALAAYWQELQLSESEHRLAAQRMHLPTPRVELGMALRGIARAALDISDGLAGDLGHILKRSGVGASLQVDDLPAGPVLATQAEALRRQFCLTGGDDYEICFTAAPAQRQQVLAAAAATATPVCRIGQIDATPGLRLFDRHGQRLQLALQTFDHFSTP